MKKFLLVTAVILVLSMLSTAQAQTINVWVPVVKGQWKTVAWDAVTQLTDLDPIPDPADAALSYNVYAKNMNTQTVISIATGITVLSQEIVLPKRGRYLAGVEAQLLYTGETEPSKSAISWSDNATVCQAGQTFGLKFQTGPKDATGLR